MTELFSSRIVEALAILLADQKKSTIVVDKSRRSTTKESRMEAQYKNRRHAEYGKKLFGKSRISEGERVV
jgi:hypothetical protein